MMKTLSAYLPQDRQQALKNRRILSARSFGTALFADISGFTPLTEQLTQQLGPRRGVEELTKRINYIYDTLIHLVELHGGSVISFAGDAITCWFDHSLIDRNSSLSSSRLAVNAAFAMQ